MQDDLNTFNETFNAAEALPFSPAQIEATLGYLMTQEEFFLQAIRLVKYHWFDDQTTGRIWEELCKFHKEFGRVPLREEFKGWLSRKSGLEHNAMFASIDRCLDATKRFGFDFIRKQCTSWLRAVLIKETYSNLYDLYYNKKDISGAMAYADQKCAELRRADFVPEKVISFADIGKIIMENEKVCLENACTTGSQQFDRALLKAEGAIGGLAPGDNTVVLAPVGVGKTAFMTTVAIHNIRRGKDVLMVVHEDTEENVRRRILMCALKCPEEDLVKWFKDPVQFEIIKEWEDRFTKHLTYVHLQNPAGNFVEDVVNMIVQRNQERKRMNNGKGYDLLIDDYPGKLLTRERRKEDLRIQMHFIYSCFADVAATEKLHCISAVQSNRAGSKANREQERKLVMEDVSEAWGIPMIANNFITINRAETEIEKKIIHFHIDKCRRNRPGRIVTCPTKFEWYQTHGDDIAGDIAVTSDWERLVNPNNNVEGISPNGQNNATTVKSKENKEVSQITSRAKPIEPRVPVDPEAPELERIRQNCLALKTQREQKLEQQRQQTRDEEEVSYAPLESPPEPEEPDVNSQS